MINRREFGALGAWGATCLLGQPALARQTPYPAKPITIVVPWAAGGAADYLARVVGQRLGERLEVPVLVDNRPGASGNIGSRLVAQANPDGHTLLMASSSNCVNVTLMPTTDWDFVRDFAPISNVGLAPNVLVLNPAVQANNVAELVALAKSMPGKLTYGSAGNGTASHLGAEKFKLAAGVRITGVPYKGAAPAVTDLLGGHISMMFTVLVATLPHIQSGKLKAVAVATPERLRLLPEAPTVAETGFPGFESSIWYGLVAPAKTPQPFVEILNKEVRAILQEPAVAEKVHGQGILPIGDLAPAFARTVHADIEKYRDLIRRAGITPG